MIIFGSRFNADIRMNAANYSRSEITTPTNLESLCQIGRINGFREVVFDNSMSNFFLLDRNEFLFTLISREVSHPTENKPRLPDSRFLNMQFCSDALGTTQF